MNTTLNFQDQNTAERVAKYLQDQNLGTFKAQGSQVLCNWQSEAQMSNFVARILTTHISFAYLMNAYAEEQAATGRRHQITTP